MVDLPDPDHRTARPWADCRWWDVRQDQVRKAAHLAAFKNHQHAF